MRAGRPQNGSNATTTVDGKKLSEARMAAEMSLDEVAAALNCNKSSVSRWEQGVLKPSTDRALKMVILFKTSDFIIAEAS